MRWLYTHTRSGAPVQHVRQSQEMGRGEVAAKTETLAAENIQVEAVRLIAKIYRREIGVDMTMFNQCHSSP